MLTLTPNDFIAIRLSLQVAVTATIVTLPLGFAVAYLLAITKFRGKAMLEGIVNLPLVLPPVVTGYLLLLLFGRNGWLGQALHSFGINIIFTLRGAVIASAVVGFPSLSALSVSAWRALKASICRHREPSGQNGGIPSSP